MWTRVPTANESIQINPIEDAGVLMLRPADPAIKALCLEHQSGSRVLRGLSDSDWGPRLNAHTRILLSPPQRSVGVLIHVHISIQHSGRVQIYLVFLMGIWESQRHLENKTNRMRGGYRLSLQKINKQHNKTTDLGGDTDCCWYTKIWSIFVILKP